MADPFITSQIQRLPLFARCTPEQIEAVATFFQVYRYAPGQALYQQGDRSQGLFLFASGAGQLSRRLGNGVPQPVAQVQPGEFIGESSLFAGDPRDVTAVAVQESIVLVLTRAALDQALHARPDLRPALNMQTNDRQQVNLQQERGIRADEQVLLTTRRHLWALISKVFRAAIIGVLIITFAVLLGRLPAADGFAFGTGVFGLLLPFLLGIYWFLDWRNDFYTVTTQRVIHEVRVLITGAIRRDQILTGAIQTVELSRVSYLAEVLGFADILLGSQGRTQPLILKQIPHAPQVQQAIFDQTQLRAQGGIPTNTVVRGTTLRDLGGFFPPMRFVDGQRIVYHKHPVVLARYISRAVFGFLLLGLILILAGIFRKQLGELASGSVLLVFSLIWLAVNFLILGWAYLVWLGDVYIIDGEILIDIRRSPLGWREFRSQAGLRQVQNVSSAIRSVIGRIFNYGDVYIQTAAAGGAGKLDFNDVPNPQGVADEILRRLQVIEDSRAGRRV